MKKPIGGEIKLVSTELMQKFDVDAARPFWRNNQYNWAEYAVTRSDLISFLEQLSDYRVIEIGPGLHPINRLFPCKEYIGVQPFETGWEDYRKVGEEYVRQDGLSFLVRQEPKSAVVVSFGVLDEGILRNSKVGDFRATFQYEMALAAAMLKVAHPFAIIDADDARKLLGEPDLLRTACGGVYSGR